MRRRGDEETRRQGDEETRRNLLYFLVSSFLIA